MCYREVERDKRMVVQLNKGDEESFMPISREKVLSRKKYFIQ